MKPKRPKPLANAAVMRLAIPAEKLAQLLLTGKPADHFVPDPTLPGFSARLRKESPQAEIRRSWYAQKRRRNGTTYRESLGDVRAIPADEARKIARQRFAMLELGRDPRAEQEQAKAEAQAAKQTLGPLIAKYLKVRKSELRPSSYKGVEYYLEKLCRKLHGMPVASIKRADVAAVIQEIASDHGKISGRSARSALRRLWRWLIEAGICEANPLVGTGDPAAGVEPRQRVLTLAEIKIVWAACEDLGAFGPLVRLLLMLGLRRCEIGGIAWAELDGDVLTIPAARVKGARDHVLTLPPQALAILADMPKRGPYVFGQGGQSGFSAWSSAKLRLDAKVVAMTGAPPPKWNLHDLRRTARSNMGRLGIRPDICELVIGHRKEGIRATYDVYDFAPEIAHALRVWADYLTDVVEDRARVVVPMREHALGG